MTYKDQRVAEGVEDAVVPPEMLKRIAEIWAATLKVEQVRPEDSFFDLGGDSMMLMMVLSRVREEFNVELAQNSVFRSPSLQDFCLTIAEAKSADDDLDFDEGFL